SDSVAAVYDRRIIRPTLIERRYSRANCNSPLDCRSYERDVSLEEIALGCGDAAWVGVYRSAGAFARRTNQRALDCDRGILRGGGQLPLLQHMHRGENSRAL